MSYYESSRPWPAVGQNAWNDLDIDGQTVRSGASSTVPSQMPPPPAQGQEGVAFSHQLEGTSTLCFDGAGQRSMCLLSPTSRGVRLWRANLGQTEVDRAIDNLVKSGKMFGAPGRREWNSPPTGPARKQPGFGECRSAFAYKLGPQAPCLPIPTL